VRGNDVLAPADPRTATVSAGQQRRAVGNPAFLPILLRTTYGMRSTASRLTFIGKSSRRHGQRPSISSHQRPTKEGSYHNQPGEKTEARESELDRYGFHYVSSNQDFEAKQQRSTNPYFILIVMPLYISSMYKDKSRPDDTSNYDEDAKNFDADANQMD
jgi:hypothetical protein